MLEGLVRASPATGGGTRLEERTSRRFKCGDGSRFSLRRSHVGKGFTYLPSLFSLCSWFGICPERGPLEAGINPLPAAGSARLNFPKRFCGFWLTGPCWFSSFYLPD